MDILFVVPIRLKFTFETHWRNTDHFGTFPKNPRWRQKKGMWGKI